MFECRSSRSIYISKKYVDRDAIETADSSDLRATLTIELKNDKRDQVLKMIFGDDNLDLLNK